MKTQCVQFIRASARAAAIAAALVLGGCVTTTQTSPGNPTFPPPVQVMQSTSGQRSGGSSSLPPPRSGDNANFNDMSRVNDPCAANLQDLGDALLLFYSSRQQLPDNLPALGRYATPGTSLNLSCPVSQQPYVYDPNGPALSNSVWLTNAAGKSVNISREVRLGQIVIYDATPAHHGERWVLIFGQDTRGTSMVATPYRIPERAFQEAMRAPRSPAPAGPGATK